ncbi:NLP/P60 family protein [Alloactinosynnema sp. L-07]|uniref:C40 family peptidase n=1 Tax=Alloactinosynnema sp. L-07 TaxID=1653480 RepID=UPI00065EF11E|nr:C40 family peptidase [Alloactinosynnema sp. L-07]CRK59291.1 NLP/P60 family protein [Alloactinosynnema sp. L-07]
MKLTILASAIILLVIVFVTTTMGGGTVEDNRLAVGACTIDTAQTGGQPHSDTSPVAQRQATLNASQLHIAGVIVAVGKGMNVTERGTAIALATAMQESTLDPNATNGRSIGLFQQQGDLYAAVRRTDPADTSRAFYEQLIARVPSYHEPTAIGLADAAQTVQASGAGASHYAAWEHWATTLAQHLYNGTTTSQSPGSVRCAAGTGSGPIRIAITGWTIQLPPEAGLDATITFPNEMATGAAAAALSYLDTPYAWGGGDPNGPTRGISDNGGPADALGDYNKTGFDCSGLTLYAYAQVGVALPHKARDQFLGAKALARFPDESQPGDLIFWGTHHVAMYLGPIGGIHYMVEAPQSGDVVKISTVRAGGDFRGISTKPWA